MVGYYLAAMLIDHRFYGRTRMQAVGFAAIFILFIISAALYPQLTVPGTPVKVFQFMYFFSSFWSQFGPNGTTFLLAAEVYPAPVRATAHGFSAACGKLSALVPAILYNYVGNRNKFWIVSWFGLIGFLLTVIFVADTTGLDLREQERYWLCVRENRIQDYHGIAIHSRHLSLWESMVLKRNRYYDPDLDRLDKIKELRERYEASIASEKYGSEEDLDDHDEPINENIIKYFELEKKRSGYGEKLSKSGSRMEKAREIK
jgi:hypothetical protein